MNKETIFEHRIKDLLQNGKLITDEEKAEIAKMYEEWEMKQPKDPTPERTEYNGESPFYSIRRFEESL